MSNLLRETLNVLAAIGLVTACVATLAFPLELIKRSDRTRKKRLAIRTYAKRLSRLLRVRYGLQEKYTPVQVKGMMKEWGYSTAYDCYGLAMFCDYADFIDYHRAIGESCNYEAMRNEISDCLFHADTTFSVSDVIEADIHSEHSEHHSHNQDYGEHHNYDHDYGGHDGGESYSEYD